MNRPTVFISHSFSDEGWTREFANSLQQRGVKVWLDSNAIHAGHSLTEAIEKGLRESNVIALLVTPDTITRPNLFFEIGAALGMGKPLIPVVSKDLDPSALPASLRNRRYLLKRSPEVTAQEFVSQALEF
jgi:ABC-type branched-subunit amino acid transport system substrate-binding protein